MAVPGMAVGQWRDKGNPGDPEWSTQTEVDWWAWMSF